jgi:hypothetical protein
MGMGSPHRLAVGLVVLVAALSVGIAVAAASSSDEQSSRVVHGMVDRSGLIVSGADGWRVVHDEPGRYRLEFDGTDPRVEIERWDAVADVTVVPLGDGAGMIRFTNDTGPVDTSFSFTAIVDR